MSQPSYEEEEKVQAIATGSNIEHEDNNWQIEIKKFLTAKELSKDKKKARRIQIKAARYTMMDNKLYQKSWDGPMLKRCFTEREGREVMRQILEGVCRNHTGETCTPIHWKSVCMV